MSNEPKPNVKVRVHAYAAQVANDQVHKVISEATAQAVQDLICEAVEEALDLSWKAHNAKAEPTEGDKDKARAWLVNQGETDPDETRVLWFAGLTAEGRHWDDFREWLKPVREEAAKDLDLSPTVRAFLARYLA